MNDNSATAVEAAQEVTSKVEALLYPEATETEEPPADSDVVLEDANELPKGDDTDLDEDDEPDDLDDIANLEEEDEATLATYLGIDEDKLVVENDGSVSVTAVIDGESKQVPMKDLVASYQTQGHVNNKSMALETDRRTFEEQKQEVAVEIKTRLEGVTQLTNVLEEQILGEYNSINWADLRVSDPAEYTAARQDFSDRANKIQQVQALAQQENQRMLQENQRNMVTQRAQHLMGEVGKMVVNNPTWSDQAVMKSEMDSLGEFVIESYGFTEEDLKAVGDARVIEMIKDAKAFRQGKKAVAKKLVSKLPKFQKPGAPKRNSASLKKARVAKAHKQAIKDSGGSIDAVAKSLIDRM